MAIWNNMDDFYRYVKGKIIFQVVSFISGSKPGKMICGIKVQDSG